MTVVTDFRLFPFKKAELMRLLTINGTIFLAFWAECYSQGMEITVKLPDDVAQHANPGREALEALVIEGYRSGTLSPYQARQLLGMGRIEFEDFLKARNIAEYAYGLEDLEQDEETLRQLESKGLL